MQGIAQDGDNTDKLKRERRLTLDLMRSVSQPTNLHELMQEVLELVCAHTDAEAVGIRLRDGCDYPYFEYRGFSREFIHAESRLCPKLASTDEPVVLDCMCGNVIQARTDPSQPFFTQQGSFWSNCTTRLLASTTADQRQSTTRNRCNGEGYESVALIPLRYRGETFGLIQVNDKRPQRLTPETIDLLERLAAAVAVALRQRQTDAQLQDAFEAMKVLLNEVHHRVKNSLQLAASLLKLGAGRVTDPVATEVILHTQERIQAIALAHEMLFASPAASRVVLSGYLNELVHHVVTAWTGDTSRVAVTTSVSQVEVDTNAVVPVGLVVAELLGNALRHAFPGDRSGEVRVTLSQSDGCRARLTVHDNGVGLPEDIELESSPGFGLRMIAILRRQIGATVEIDRSSGTSVHLVLPALLGGAQ